MAIDQSFIVIALSCLLVAHLAIRLTGLGRGALAAKLALGAALTFWWMAGPNHGLHVQLMGGVVTVLLGLRHGLPRGGRGTRAATASRRGALPRNRLWSWMWHGAGLGAGAVSVWTLVAMLVSDGAGFDLPRLAILAFYFVYTLVSTGAIRWARPLSLAALLAPAAQDAPEPVVIRR
ncbi:hypothetical protein [Oceaniglobus roseus]|uniref:hypothetical protein n=1 Tax=Oceaniglobus roseus TaxID=1737570 RepID=UPI000C7E8687|nr:hypothetical protein [Kandeliimicrobium roseum]